MYSGTFLGLLGPEDEGRALFRRSVIIYHSTWHNVPEDLNLYERCSVNLKSKLVCWNLRNEEWCKNLPRYVSLNCGELKWIDHDSSIRKHGAKRLCPNWYFEPVIPLSEQPETPQKS